MPRSFEFLKKVVDSVADNIVVVDERGQIVFTNRSWDAFGRSNACTIQDSWIGIDYLSVCDNAAAAGDTTAAAAAKAIRRAILLNKPSYLEYPCHSPDQKRWFMMSTTSFEHNNATYVAVSHTDITQRKLAEEQAVSLSNLDGLTGVFNRRYFDAFLREEWHRCTRLRLPVTLAMVDIDHFKLLNDSYGHQFGDDCLVQVSNVLQAYARRPGDICARYGGEEFVLVFGESELEKVLPNLEQMLNEIRALDLPNERSPTAPIVTASIGVASMYPSRGMKPELLVEQADARLYAAKNNGRNRIESSDGLVQLTPDGRGGKRPPHRPDDNRHTGK